MRIVYIIISKGYGGLERHLIELANEMVKQHEVYVVADASFANALANSIKHIPYSANTSRYNPIAIWRLRHILQQIQPDVIHAQANKAAHMVAFTRVRAKANIATLHNQKNDLKPFEQFDGVIAVSASAGVRLKHHQIAIIHNGIAPPDPINSVSAKEFRRAWCSDDEPLTISVGRLVPAKGFDILLHAWKDLPGKLVIIGSGPDEIKLKQLQLSLNLGEKVVFAGYRKDVPMFMATADLLVISSRREGFPYVLIEALHAGVPIVSTNIPGAAEYLPKDAVIYSKQPQDVYLSVKHALNQYHDLKIKYQSYFDKARKDLQLSIMVEQTEAFYNKIIIKNQLKSVG
jgi:glycosyltransferase involved in cell wall biosynthesis